MSNPFETGPVQSPAHFIGRREECDLVRRILREGKQPPHRLRNILISGEEGTGKSSLMRHTAWLAEREDYYVVTETARGFKNASPPLVSYLHFFMYALLRKAQADKLFDDVLDFPIYLAALQRLPLTGSQVLNLDMLDFPSWYYGYAQSPGAGAAPIAPWCHDLRVVLELAEKKRGIPGCLFVLDDVDALSSEDTRVLLDTVQSIFDSLEECRVMFVLVGDNGLRRLVQRQKGMSTIFVDLQLRPWSFEDVCEYVRRQELQDEKLRAPDERIRELLEITEGNPATLSLLCSHIFEACKNHTQQNFAPSEAILEEVSRYIEGISDFDVIERIKRLTQRDFLDLAHVAPFDGWTVEEIARFKLFDAQSAGLQSDLATQEDSLQRIKELYVKRGILQSDLRTSVEGNSLERAFLRFRARKLKVDWAEQFRDRTPEYEEWVVQAIQSFVTRVSEESDFPLHKWVMWRVADQSLPESLEKRITDRVLGIKEATTELSFESRQLSIVEETPGKYVYIFANLESPFLDLLAPETQVAVDILGIQFSVGERSQPIIQLYRMPGNSTTNLAPIITAINSLASLLDLRSLDTWSGHFELPNLEGLIALAASKSNSTLMMECFRACLSIGRRCFERGEMAESQKWFCTASTMPSELISPTTLAIAHNNYGFVSIGLKDWELAKDKLSLALQTYSRDSMFANRAMTIYDLAYIEAMQGRFTEAERRCLEALEDPNNDTRCGFLWVKLCDIDGLPPQNYWDTELARRPLVAAAINCTLAAIYAHRKKWAAADQALAQAEELDGEHYIVLRALGRYHLRRGRPDEARELLKRAQEAYLDLMEQLSEAPGGQPIPVSLAIYDEMEYAERLEAKL